MFSHIHMYIKNADHSSLNSPTRTPFPGLPRWQRRSAPSGTWQLSAMFWIKLPPQYRHTYQNCVIFWTFSFHHMVHPWCFHCALQNPFHCKANGFCRFSGVSLFRTSSSIHKMDENNHIHMCSGIVWTISLSHICWLSCHWTPVHWVQGVTTVGDVSSSITDLMHLCVSVCVFVCVSVCVFVCVSAWQLMLVRICGPSPAAKSWHSIVKGHPMSPPSSESSSDPHSTVVRYC